MGAPDGSTGWHRWLVHWTDAIVDTDLEPSRRLVAFVMAKRADNATGVVNLKRAGMSPRALLARLTGESERTVSRAIADLKAAGLLSVAKRGPYVTYTLLDADTGSRHDGAVQGPGHDVPVTEGPGHGDLGTAPPGHDGSRHGVPHVSYEDSSVLSSPIPPVGHERAAAPEAGGFAGEEGDGLGEFAALIAGVLQRGVDSLTTDERCKPATASAVLDVLRVTRPDRDIALAVAQDTRSIVQSQNRAPNVVGLYRSQLAKHGQVAA